MRASLGLAPLEITKDGEDGGEGKKEDFVHKPAVNISKKKEEEKIREKIRLMQEKRKLNKKFNKVGIVLKNFCQKLIVELLLN